MDFQLEKCLAEKSLEQVQGQNGQTEIYLGHENLKSDAYLSGF